MSWTRLGAVLLAGILSCRASGNGSDVPSPSAPPPGSALAPGPVSAGRAEAPEPTRAAAPASSPAPWSAPPPVERRCTRDDECAVAKVEVTGEHACCAACGTTPGTRRWFAQLQLFCGAHPPRSCYPLGCPAGPTRAVCRAGACEATPSDADGRPIYLADERKCLPAMICDEWAGCALVAGNAQDGWFVQESSRVAVGTLAALEKNVCTAADAGRCEAARLYPPDAACPPHTEPPLIAAPPFSCTLESGRCRSVGR
jgi:hypothetical protein